MYFNLFSKSTVVLCMVFSPDMGESFGPLVFSTEVHFRSEMFNVMQSNKTQYLLLMLHYVYNQSIMICASLTVYYWIKARKLIAFDTITDNTAVVSTISWPHWAKFQLFTFTYNSFICLQAWEKITKLNNKVWRYQLQICYPHGIDTAGKVYDASRTATFNMSVTIRFGYRISFYLV